MNKFKAFLQTVAKERKVESRVSAIAVGYLDGFGPPLGAAQLRSPFHDATLMEELASQGGSKRETGEANPGSSAFVDINDVENYESLF